ncbi:MAG: hypothetical protein WCA38_06525 [Candidatus Acidiferrales bacterium]
MFKSNFAGCAFGKVVGWACLFVPAFAQTAAQNSANPASAQTAAPGVAKAQPTRRDILRGAYVATDLYYIDISSQ